MRLEKATGWKYIRRISIVKYEIESYKYKKARYKAKDRIWQYLTLSKELKEV